MRVLTSSVLVAEAIVVWLAIPVAVLTEGAPTAVAWGLAVIGLAALLLPMQARRAWYLPAGWLLQVLVLASGVVVPMMLLLGAVFSALWWAAIHFGSQPGRQPSRS